MEDIAATGDLGQRQGLAGAEAGAEVGDDGVGGEAVLGQFQQPHRPGVGIAVLLLAQEVAERGGGVDTHQDRVAGLEDLVMGSDADGGQVVRVVDRAGPGDGGLDDVMDGAQGGLGVEEVTQQRDDAAVRAVTGQDQGEDQLTEPGRGDRQVEEDLLGRWRRVEGVVQGELGGVGLSVEELAADLMLAGQLGDRLRAVEDLEGQLLPLLGRELLSGARDRDGGRERIGLHGGNQRHSLSEHVCFLRVMALAWNPIASMEEAGISEKLPLVTLVLPDFEPGRLRQSLFLPSDEAEII